MFILSHGFYASYSGMLTEQIFVYTKILRTTFFVEIHLKTNVLIYRA